MSNERTNAVMKTLGLVIGIVIVLLTFIVYPSETIATIGISLLVFFVGLAIYALYKSFLIKEEIKSGKRTVHIDEEDNLP